MEDLEVEGERTVLISRLYALLTAKLEDAAAIAGDCQARRPAAELRKGAWALIALAEEVLTVASAVAALLEHTARCQPR